MVEERRCCLMLMPTNWSCCMQSKIRHGGCVRWTMHGSLVPSHVAQFQYCEPSPGLQTDTAGYKRELSGKCSKAGSWINGHSVNIR